MSPQNELYNSNSKKNGVVMASVGDVHVHNDGSRKSTDGCCKQFTDRVIGALENWFASLGDKIARYPIRVIIISITVSLLCIVGVLEYYSENRPEKLWVASDSKSLEHSKWISDRYPPQSRLIGVVVEMENVLTPQGMRVIVEIDKKVKMIGNGTDIAWSNICLPRGNSPICLQQTLLQIWDFNYTLMLSLSNEQILENINKANLTDRAGKPINVQLLLGGRTYENGKMERAKAVKFTYFLRNQEVFVASQGRMVDEKGQKWEEEFNEEMKKEINGATVYLYSFQLVRDDGGSTISGDLQFLFIGYVLIITYLAVMLGSFSRINHKIWLAVCGVACIGLSIGVAYGLSSAFQLMVTPVHSILPFLLLGIGVDDVFVIVQNWDNFGGPENTKKSIPENVAVAMRHAGVSILVTSFTDVCAFLIGATTILPALRSFCIFAGIGVLVVFILTCTLFVAWLALDSKRQRNRRDACCCCITLGESWQPLECSRKSYLQSFMKNTYSKIILSTPGRIICIMITAGLLAGGAYGLSQLKQNFDPDWFLPPDSLSVKYNQAIDKYFSEEGFQSYVYVGEVNYFADSSKLDKIHQILLADPYVVPSLVDSWYDQYKTFLKTSVNQTLLNADLTPKTEEDFYKYFNMFMRTEVGLNYYGDIKVRRDKTTNLTTSIYASRIKFSHVKLEGASEEIKAMDSIQDDFKEMKFSNGFVPFAYTRVYVSWETNKVISQELIRNLILAGVIVFLVTLFLIANLWVSLLVVTCVVFTLINIAGYMHFWGLTVDTVTTIQLILAIGLSVDYSAHIGHGFMASRDGNRVDRAANALGEIGPAVVHGGFSTFLAFVFLAGSESYVFSTFFKLFFLVVVFGLFHGLVYLPVVLSLIGPKPYARSHTEEAEVVDNSQEMKSTQEKSPTSFTYKTDPYHNGKASEMNEKHLENITTKENTEKENTGYDKDTIYE